MAAMDELVEYDAAVLEQYLGKMVTTPEGFINEDVLTVFVEPNELTPFPPVSSYRPLLKRPDQVQTQVEFLREFAAKRAASTKT